jgi:site-specific recombinase XerD
MSVRQLPLFQSQPASPEDLNKFTPFAASLPLFSQHLHREGKSEHTVKAFMSDLALVAEYLGEGLPLGQFSTENLDRFLHWLEYGRDVPCSRKSYARRVTTLKVFFKWLHGVGAIPHDPAKAVVQRSGPAPLSDVLSMEQIRRCIDFAQRMRKGDEQDYRPEMLLRLLLDTGIKKSEAMLLTNDHIDRLNPNNPILLVRHKVRNVFRERRIDLDPEWIKVLDLYLFQYGIKEHAPIFNCTARNLEYILTDIGEGAGIEVKLSFEMLRWTSAVRDYRLGMEEELIREKLGLSKISWHETGAKVRRLSVMLDEQSA